MRSLVARCALFVVALSLAACGTFRSFNLPVTTYQGVGMVPQLRVAAEELGLQPSSNNEAVWFAADPAVRLSFQATASRDQFVMLVHADSNVPPDQLEERVKAAKAKGDAVWSRAMAIRREMAAGAP